LYYNYLSSQRILSKHLLSQIMIQRTIFNFVFMGLALALLDMAHALDYPYATAEPQKSGWPLTEEELAYVLKPEHERRPGSELYKHLPAMWPE